MTGATGMLGHALFPVLQQSHQVVGVGAEDFDIRDERAVRDCLSANRPELVVHLAAYTDVDGCETDPQRAVETNGTGTQNVARACAEINSSMLYVSTDYVFDGTKTEPYREQDRPNPINVYGQSKLAGERHVEALLDRYFIVRTSWLFGPKGKNFVATILKLAQRQTELHVVIDQHGSPTYTRHLASSVALLVGTGKYGIYHISGSGSCSWFGFAQTILDLSGFQRVRLVPISSEECARPARRPANSVLENHRLSDKQMGLLPHWRVALAEYLDELRLGSQQDLVCEGQGGNHPIEVSHNDVS
jgi:dTDP-4-dehydrorhamnose reductase